MSFVCESQWVSVVRLLLYLPIGSTGRDTGSQNQQIVPMHDHSDATCTGYIPATDVARMHPICELQEVLTEWFPMKIIHLNKVNVDTLDVDDEVHIRIRHSECSGGLVGEPLKPGWVAFAKCWHVSILVLQQVEKYLPRFAALDVLATYNMCDVTKGEERRNALGNSELCKAGHTFEALRLLELPTERLQHALRAALLRIPHSTLTKFGKTFVDWHHQNTLHHVANEHGAFSEPGGAFTCPEYG